MQQLKDKQNIHLTNVWLNGEHKLHQKCQFWMGFFFQRGLKFKHLNTNLIDNIKYEPPFITIFIVSEQCPIKLLFFPGKMMIDDWWLIDWFNPSEKRKAYKIASCAINLNANTNILTINKKKRKRNVKCVFILKCCHECENFIIDGTHSVW